MANPISNAWKNAWKSTKENMSGFDEFQGGGNSQTPNSYDYNDASTIENSGSPMFQPINTGWSDFGNNVTYPENAISGANPTPNPTPTPTPAPSGGMDPREFARGGEGGFDPTDTESVKKMQEMLKVQNPDLKVDGILGPQTEKALRGLQGVPYQESQGEGGIGPSGPSDATGVDSEINMSNEPNAQEWIQSMDSEYMKPDDEADYVNPELQGRTQDEADFQAEEQAWLKNANTNVSKYEANAQESYYDDFFDEEQNKLNPSDDEVPYEGDSGEGEQWPVPYEEGELQGPPTAPFNASMGVNPAFDATATKGINRFMPGSPGNFGKGTGGVGMQYKGNILDLDMGEAPAENNINKAMNNNKSDEELMQNGQIRDPKTGDLMQLEEILDDDGNFQGWGSPGAERSEAGPSEYDVGPDYPQPSLPFKVNQNPMPHQKPSSQSIVDEFLNRSRS